MLSAAECDQIQTSHLVKGTRLKSPVIIIIRLMLSLFVWPKEVTFIGFYFIHRVLE